MESTDLCLAMNGGSTDLCLAMNGEYGSMFSNEWREYRFMFSNEWREYGSISMLIYWRYLQAGGLSLLGTFFFKVYHLQLILLVLILVYWIYE